jgi:hypothetical protein
VKTLTCSDFRIDADIEVASHPEVASGNGSFVSVQEVSVHVDIPKSEVFLMSLKKTVHEGL